VAFTRLAARARIAPDALAGAVDALVSEGRVSCEPGPGDDGAGRVRLTGAGRRFVDVTILPVLGMLEAERPPGP
jgi:hypothetical protein